MIQGEISPEQMGYPASDCSDKRPGENERFSGSLMYGEGDQSSNSRFRASIMISRGAFTPVQI